jgi:hypothetical protein
MIDDPILNFLIEIRLIWLSFQPAQIDTFFPVLMLRDFFFPFIIIYVSLDCFQYFIYFNGLTPQLSKVLLQRLITRSCRVKLGMKHLRLEINFILSWSESGCLTVTIRFPWLNSRNQGSLWWLIKNMYFLKLFKFYFCFFLILILFILKFECKGILILLFC